MRKVLLTVFLFAAAAPASAEIAVFVDGRSMKIDSYVVDGGTLSLTMPSGGIMHLPLVRVERIIDDEVEPAVEEVTELPSLFARRTWRFDAGVGPLFRSPWDEILIEAGRTHDLDVALLSAVIKVESDYNPRVVSHKGARGLMQLMPATAKRFGVTDSHDPRQSIHAGARYLRWLLDKFEQNPELALAGYNAGEGNVMKYGGVPPFRETVEYVKRISRHLERLGQVASFSPAAAGS